MFLDNMEKDFKQLSFVSLNQTLVREKVNIRPIFKQSVHHRGISHCCSVTNILVILCNMPQNSSHDLPRASLRKPGGILNDVRGCKWSDFGAN